MDSCLPDLARYRSYRTDPMEAPPHPQVVSAAEATRWPGPVRSRMEMNWPHYGDEFNKWYVALTRAKRVLSVPAKLLQLVREFASVATVGTDVGPPARSSCEQLAPPSLLPDDCLTPPAAPPLAPTDPTISPQKLRPQGGGGCQQPAVRREAQPRWAVVVGGGVAGH